MNHPLRYAGETFYQSSFKPDDSGTVLQVVRNPGWLLPYVSCAMVAVGLLIHFGMRLVPAVRKRAGADEKAARSSRDDALALPHGQGYPCHETRMQRLLPWVVAALAVVYVAGGFFGRGATRDGMDLAAFGRIPVSAEGRTKPLDTFARNSVMVMSGRQEVGTDEGR